MLYAAAMAHQVLALAHLQYISRTAEHAAAAPTPFSSSAIPLQNGTSCQPPSKHDLTGSASAAGLLEQQCLQ
jgi:hypothetical protein